MKKWYFGILISAFALLVVIQQQTVVPNQEIVLEFVDVDVTSLEAQNAITIVKKQLESIGVKNPRISKGLKKGELKITYYSDADVTFIKKVLSKENNIALDHVFYDQNEGDNQLPVDESSKEYNLNVYEIHKGSDIGFDFNDTYILEVHQEQDGFASAHSYSFIKGVDANNLESLIKVAQRINTNIAIAIDNTSYKIPEVRAGPIS